MSFQLQFRSIAEELRKAGLPGDAATRVAKILANSAQPMRSGPVEVDTTPRNIRQVSPDTRKHQLTNLDFREGDPYYRRNRRPRTEERTRPTPASSVQAASSPQTSENPYRVSAGSFTEARSGADGVEVGLRISGTGPILVQDTASGSLVGKTLRAEADTGEAGFLRFFVEEQAGEYILKLQLDREALAKLIYETLGVEPPGQPRPDEFPTPPLPSLALVNASLDGRGLCFTRTNGEVFCLPTTPCDQQ
jgi:hypothetical protein